MKTAEEIYKTMYEAMPFHIHSMVKPYIIEAMKHYANAKLDEAKERIWDASLTADRYWNEKLILSLKDEV